MSRKRQRRVAVRCPICVERDGGGVGVGGGWEFVCVCVVGGVGVVVVAAAELMATQATILL
jgi:hypothetical protein